MAEQEVCSPVSRKGSRIGSNQPTSPGAKSSPSRGSALKPITFHLSHHTAAHPGIPKNLQVRWR